VKASRSALILLLIPLLFSCGRKGPPRWVEHVAPEAPTGLGAQVRPGSVTLRWDYDEEADIEGFSVQRKVEGAEGDFVEIARTTETRYTDTDVSAGEAYRYRISARGEREEKEKGGQSTRAVRVSPPAGMRPPGDVRVAVQGGTLVVSWSFAQEGSLFHVYKSQSPGEHPLEPVSPDPVPEHVFETEGEPYKTVYFTVRNVAASPGLLLEGPPSEEVMVGPEDYVPSAPVSFGAAVVPGKVQLFWEHNAEPWVRGYRVYRAEGAEGEGDFAPIGETQTPAFTDPEPPAGRLRYRVRAVGPVTEGEPSEAVEVTAILP
jgi:hypothetical protein